MAQSYQTPGTNYRPAASRKKWYRKWWVIVLLFILAIIIAFGVAIAIYTATLYYKIKTGQINPELLFEQGQNIDQNTNTVTAIRDDAPYLGEKNAPIVIVEFGDFGCPKCKESAAIIKELNKLYPKQIKIIFRHYPLITENSQVAALAAECAFHQGNIIFWAYADKLFAHQDFLDVNSLKKYATEIGIGGKEFDTCLDKKEELANVQKDILEAKILGVNGTPTFFIGSKKISGVVPLDIWKKSIDQSIKLIK